MLLFTALFELQTGVIILGFGKLLLGSSFLLFLLVILVLSYLFL